MSNSFFILAYNVLPLVAGILVLSLISPNISDKDFHKVTNHFVEVTLGRHFLSQQIQCWVYTLETYLINHTLLFVIDFPSYHPCKLK